MQLSFRLDKRPGDFTAFYGAARISLSVCCELGWPRSASIAMLLETRDLLHQHDRKRKVVVIKTRRYKRQFCGSFFASETDMIFRNGVGGLRCSRPFLPEIDVFLDWNSAAEGAWVGLGLDLQGGTGFNLLRVQFWIPVQKKRVSKRSESDPP